MKIYTTYFANLKKLPKNIVPIAISLSKPIPMTSYEKLYPTWNILNAYKNGGDEEKYIKEYTVIVLNRLNPNAVYEDLKRLSNGNDVALVCYERPEKFCHRHLVAEWMTANGYSVSEWNK